MGKKRKERTGQNRAGFDMRKKYTIRHTYMNTWSCRQTEPSQGRKAKVQKREERRRKKRALAHQCQCLFTDHRPRKKDRAKPETNQPPTNQHEKGVSFTPVKSVAPVPQLTFRNVPKAQKDSPVGLPIVAFPYSSVSHFFGSVLIHAFQSYVWELAT